MRYMRFPILLFAATLGAQDFAKDVLPLLAKNCSGCHNDTKKTSGLSLTSMDAIRRGGNRGPAAQLLTAALRQTGDLKMPPGRKLDDAEIRLVEQWAAKQPRAVHWAFQRPVASPGASIDGLVRAGLAKAGLKPSPEAAKSTLLRRVHLDLTGLPPSPAETEAFVSGQVNYEQVVDRLLASPGYGERWARHWLDQVRYADSDGGSRDEPRQIWKYREYVIDAMNSDKPFDRFVVEQLAGDLLPNATLEQRIATGMQRNSLLQIEAGTDRELYRTEAVSDRVDMFGTVFLGLATGCARCHDHKFDPITHREYYQLFSFFNNVDEYSNDVPPFSDTGDLEITHQPFAAIGKPEDVEKYKTVRSMLLALQKERTAYLSGRQLDGKDANLTLRNVAIGEVKKLLPNPKPTLAMVMEEMPAPREAYVLQGGDYQRRGAKVLAEIPAFLHGVPDGKPKNRLDLANWLVDPANPLLARVTVNRIWMRYFGRGIVATENDFGRMGERPSHPELLDYLATEFMKGRWSQKAIHKLIVTSATYKQSSNSRPEIEKADPQNILLARQNRIRLDAEIIRDSALTASGLLHSKLGGPSVFPPQPDGAMAASQVKKTWNPSTGEDRYRRAMYTHFWRITPHPALVVFDAPNAMMSCTRRPRTNTPLQALTLLNDEQYHEMAQALAKRIQAEGGADKAAFAFRLVNVRGPAEGELARLRRLYQAELDEFQTRPADAKAITGVEDPERAAWMTIARVLLNTDEFITRE